MKIFVDAMGGDFAPQAPVEGAIEALLGSLLAIIALHVGMNYLVPQLSNSLQFLSFNLPMDVMLKTDAALLVIGLVIGLFGSAIAMRRYLKV